MNRVTVSVLALIALLLLAACNAGQDPATPTSEPAAAPVVEEPAMEQAGDMEEMASDEMASEDMASDDMASEDMRSEDMAMDDDSQDMAAGAGLAAWQTLPLTNARTGETFMLADFAGKTVYVEPMATWCTNCRRQLGNVKEAYAQLTGDDVVFVALSVETNIGDGTLANYANEAGFDWLFAVATPEMLQALAGEFGQTIANPPATPHFVVRPDGSATDLATGIESTDQIVAQIQAAQS
jgi:thiol-disulfide isomerase/thioredoxin